MRQINDELDWAEIKQEMAQVLQRLIRIDTSPGRHGETVAAHYIQSILEADGLSSEVREPVSGKGSLICRLPGEIPDESLLLLAHLDVAPVQDESAWHHPPFSGQDWQDEIWGRGAIDCKGLAVVWLMLVLLLKRNQVPMKRGVVFAATSDEESGGKWGIDWLLKHTHDLKECRYALNEGGGFSFRLKKRDVYSIQYAEKGHFILEFTVKYPYAQYPLKPKGTLIVPKGCSLVHPIMNALFRIGHVPPALMSLLPYSMKLALFKHFSKNLPLDYDALFKNLIHIEPPVTLDQHHALIRVHVRILPGESIEDVKRRIFELNLIPSSLVREIEVTTITEPSVSSMDTPLYRMIESTMRKQASLTVTMLPFITPGATDSRYVRAHGMIAYGFFPTPPSVDIRLIHQPNERIPVDALVFALQRLYEIVTRFVTS